jgi:hypothetical protein
LKNLGDQGSLTTLWKAKAQIEARGQQQNQVRVVLHAG